MAIYAEEEMTDGGLTIYDVERGIVTGEIVERQKNIPVVSCPHCGESYLAAETLHEIERIKLHRKSFAVKRPVEVASFA